MSCICDETDPPPPTHTLTYSTVIAGDDHRDRQDHELREQQDMLLKSSTTAPNCAPAYTRTRTKRSSRHRRSSSMPTIFAALSFDEPADHVLSRQSSWPIITCTNSFTADDLSTVSDLSNGDDSERGDLDNAWYETCAQVVPENDMVIPKDSWIIQVFGDDNKSEPGATPWFKVLKQGSEGFLMLEGDEILQLIRAMIKDADINRQPLPILYLRTAVTLAAMPLPASEALTFFQAILTSLSQLTAGDRPVIDVAASSINSSRETNNDLVERVSELTMNTSGTKWREF